MEWRWRKGSLFNLDASAVKARIERRAIQVVRGMLNDEKASAAAGRVREKYPGMPSDTLAAALIKRAARKTAVEGASNSVGVTACEAILVAPVPEPAHKAAAGATAVGLLLGDMTYVTKLQMQLLLEIGEVYECPFRKDDEDDVWIVFKAALGVKGTERVIAVGHFLVAEIARKQFRKLLRTGIRRASQQYLIKLGGRQVAKYLSERYVMRLIPVLNVAIGASVNHIITKKVGYWAVVRARIRASLFTSLKHLYQSEPRALSLVQPMVFFVGTSDGEITDNILSLYAQISRRLEEYGAEFSESAAMIEGDTATMIAEACRSLEEESVRKIVFDIALITAASTLKATEEILQCLHDISAYLRIPFEKEDLRSAIKHIKR